MGLKKALEGCANDQLKKESDLDEDRGFIIAEDQRQSLIAQQATSGLSEEQKLKQLTTLYPRWDKMWFALHDNVITVWATEDEVKQSHIPSKDQPICAIFLKNCSISELCRFHKPCLDGTDQENDKEDIGFYDDMDIEERK